jgi:hypothetical protein
LGFKLEAQGLELEIGVKPIDEVYIHEETIPWLLAQLVSDIEHNGEVRNPIIVDSNTSVVLDGMHRVTALREIGCRYLPVCLVDYTSPKINVGCWYRVIRDWVGEPRLLDVLGHLKLNVESSNFEETQVSLADRKATMALFTAANCYLAKAQKTDIMESYKWIKRFEATASGEGLHISYETEPDAVWQIRSGKYSAALLVPRTTKEEVIRSALSGELFTHKTTRHTLPARPVNVSFPLGWLTGEKSLKEVDELIEKQLSKKKLIRISRGSFYEGKRYDEELLMFR